MDNLKFILIIALIPVLAGCMSHSVDFSPKASLALPPTDPASVQVFMRGQTPAKVSSVIGTGVVEIGRQTPVTEGIRLLQEEAARRGCEAVVNIYAHNVQQCIPAQASGGGAGYSRVHSRMVKVVSGTFVVWME